MALKRYVDSPTLDCLKKMLRFSSQFWVIPVLYCTCWTTKVRMADEYLAVLSVPRLTPLFFCFLSVSSLSVSFCSTSNNTPSIPL